MRENGSVTVRENRRETVSEIRREEKAERNKRLIQRQNWSERE